MRNGVFAIAVLLFLSMNSMTGQTKAGGDKDEHGCRASAGYTFSVIKNDCIRVFEQDIKLEEVNPDGTSTSIAAVIFSDDNTKAEVFVPGHKGGVVMLREGEAGNYKWKNGKLSLLEKDTKSYALLKRKKVIFKTSKPVQNPSVQEE